MKVRDVMTQDVEVIHPEATVGEAAEQMRALNVGVLPVCDGERLIGMLTDRDIVVRAVALGHDATVTRVGDIMSPHVEFCFEDEDLDSAAKLMGDRQLRRLVVLNDDKRLVGIVTLGDLSQGARETVGEALEEVSLPQPPAR